MKKTFLNSHTIKKIATAGLSVALVVGFAACSSDDGLSGGNDNNDNGDQENGLYMLEKSAHEQRFAVNLLDQLSGDDEKNVVVSPVSLSMALSMLANGATGGTLDEILTTLYGPEMTLERMNARCGDLIDEIKSLNNWGTNMHVANSLWMDGACFVYDDFISKTKNVFSADVRNVEDLTTDAARGEINRWVLEATDGKIPRLLDRNIEKNGVCLLNALYFHSSWSSRFDEKKTTDGDFTTISGKKVKARMMHHQREMLNYADYGEYEVLYLPLHGNTMEIVLPKEGKTPKSILPLLAEDRQPVESGKYRVNVALPRFSVEYGASCLVEVMRSLGINKAFDRKISEFENLTFERFQIDDILQKSTLVVNEDGVTGSAATFVFGSSSLMPEGNEIDFIVDRPFIYFIRTPWSGTVLFNGVVNTL